MRRLRHPDRRQPILSCLALPIENQAPARILTVEGLADWSTRHPLQDTFAELGAAQCGYCTPGMLVTAKALLDETLSPTRAQIVEALSGNLCRCTGYVKIFEAVTFEAIQAVAAAAYKGAHPLDNTDLNYAWRKKMARVYVERALSRVCGVDNG